MTEKETDRKMMPRMRPIKKGKKIAVRDKAVKPCGVSFKDEKKKC